MGNWVAAVLALLLASGQAWGEPRAPRKDGIGSPGYVWNAPEEEKIDALSLKGDIHNGKEIFEVCSACHLPSGAGRPDGTYPQLAGQHATVLIKEIADIRAGLRDNKPMYPFTVALSDPQELADVAAYIQTLCIPRDHGRGTGDVRLLARGRNLYRNDCTSCHGANGQGDSGNFYPVLAGQHFRYLLRQATAIRDGKRRNANPEMVRVVKKYSNRDLDAVVEYMSSLSMPGSLCRP